MPLNGSLGERTLSRARARESRRLLAWLALSVLSAGCSGPDNPLVGTNVIVVLADTLRADHLGAYGAGPGQSPFLDGLAGESVLFENSWAAAAQTAPSVLSMWSAVYPHRHGVQYYWRTEGFHPRQLRGEPAVPAGLMLMSELFSAAGYRTGAVVTNPWLHPRFGFGLGFERYEHLPSQKGGPEAYQGGEKVNEVARDLLEGWRGERFLLHLHYMDAHSPYKPPEPHRARFVEGREGNNVYRNGPRPDAEPGDVDFTRALYRGEVRALDDRVRELFDLLRELGLAESTLVVFASDHGESFLEHGGMGTAGTSTKRCCTPRSSSGTPRCASAPGA